MASDRRSRRVRGGLRYWAVSRSIHHPRLLRFIAALFRQWPGLACRFGHVARREAVAAVLKRQASFANTSHAPNLVAGSFLIGMDDGTQYDSDKRFLRHVLPSAEQFEFAGAEESAKRIDSLRTSSGRRFDLIDDYLVWVVWAALRRAFGPAADLISHGDERDLFNELRQVAAQLVVGQVSGTQVKARADACAFSLRNRIEDGLPAITARWNPGATRAADLIRRNAIGLMWVAHPVAVQAGAVVMRELMNRPGIRQDLHQRTTRLNDRAWNDAGLRRIVLDHVLELLRFRPVFPLLVRDVPRDTLCETGGIACHRIEAGSRMMVWTIGAMFDREATVNPRDYDPNRTWKNDEDRYLPFGLDERACLGKHQALAVLVSALIGLLTLPKLRYAGRWGSRIGYDGPIVSSMPLSFDG